MQFEKKKMYSQKAKIIIFNMKMIAINTVTRILSKKKNGFDTMIMYYLTIFFFNDFRPIVIKLQKA